eukprot:TRINITY_DN10821_c0_g2_i1.p1 TRINITY_DN10821_c0_g2~~TRINITY_DN10821_c0_g2_i1.p1  ORF type:complete len:273 (-),score=90.96 TRINITY_DN10821_c0_g2_i1:116-934(-)
MSAAHVPEMRNEVLDLIQRGRNAQASTGASILAFVHKKCEEVFTDSTAEAADLTAFGCAVHAMVQARNQASRRDYSCQLLEAAVLVLCELSQSASRQEGTCELGGLDSSTTEDLLRLLEQLEQAEPDSGHEHAQLLAELESELVQMEQELVAASRREQALQDQLSEHAQERARHMCSIQQQSEELEDLRRQKAASEKGLAMELAEALSIQEENELKWKALTSIESARKSAEQRCESLQQRLERCTQDAEMELQHAQDPVSYTHLTLPTKRIV